MEQRAAEWSKADTGRVEAMLEGIKDRLLAEKKSQAELEATVNELEEAVNTMEFIVLMLRFIERLSTQDQNRAGVDAIRTMFISMMNIDGDYEPVSLIKDAISVITPNHLLLQLTEADLKSGMLLSCCFYQELQLVLNGLLTVLLIRLRRFCFAEDNAATFSIPHWETLFR